MRAPTTLRECGVSAFSRYPFTAQQLWLKGSVNWRGEIVTPGSAGLTASSARCGMGRADANAAQQSAIAGHAGNIARGGQALFLWNEGATPGTIRA